MVARVRGGLRQGALSTIAAVLAWLSTQAFGLREGFWAAITAVAVTQTQLNAATSVARDQFAGAAIGGLVATLVSLAFGSGPGGFAAALVAAQLLCWVIGVESASRLAGITAVIIFLVPHQGSAIRMTLSRVGEVSWGVTVAIGLVWLTSRIAGTRDP